MRLRITKVTHWDSVLNTGSLFCVVKSYECTQHFNCHGITKSRPHLQQEPIFQSHRDSQIIYKRVYCQINTQEKKKHAHSCCLPKGVKTMCNGKSNRSGQTTNTKTKGHHLLHQACTSCVHSTVNVDHTHTITHTHQSFKNANLPVASHCSALSCNRRANDAGPPYWATKSLISQPMRHVSQSPRRTTTRTIRSRIPRPMPMQHMHALDHTLFRRLRALVDPKRTPRDAVPRRQVAPRAEQVERPFTGYRRLVRRTGERGVGGCDELRGACVEGLGGCGRDDRWFGACWGSAWVSNAVCASHEERVRKGKDVHVEVKRMHQWKEIERTR